MATGDFVLDKPDLQQAAVGGFLCYPLRQIKHMFVLK